MVIHTPDALNALLAERRYCANGKNLPVEHLYETVAASRWPYENVLGIYLTNPDHAWMAVWMAVTRRDRLRKRHLRYVRPAVVAGDHIGRIEIYNPEHIARTDLLCERAFLYLFDAARFTEALRTDVAGEADRIAAVERSGFRYQAIERRGWKRHGYASDLPEPRFLILDAWQVAAVNFGTLVPDIQVTLTEELITLLAERITFCSEEVGEEYLVD